MESTAWHGARCGVLYGVRNKAPGISGERIELCVGENLVAVLPTSSSFVDGHAAIHISRIIFLL